MVSFIATRSESPAEETASRAAVQFTLARIIQNEHETALTGAFFALNNALWAKQRRLKFDLTAPEGARGDVVRAMIPLMSAMDDFTTLFTVAYRLDWCNRLRREGSLNPSVENAFVVADIVLFHAQLRSLYDHLCEAICRTAKQPGQLGLTSFNDLLSWISKNSNRAHGMLDARLLNVLDACSWFHDVRGVRDHLIHRDREILRLNSNNERILFQIFVDAGVAVRVPPRMSVGFAVDFRLYAASLIARTFVFLEQIAEPIREHENVEPFAEHGRIHFLGVDVARAWLRLLDAPKAPDQPT